MMSLLYSFLLSFICFSHALADMGTSHGEGHLLGQGLQSTVQEAAKQTGSSRAVPGSTPERPSQASLTAGTIGEAARSEISRSQAGLFLKGVAEDRQRFVMDPETDPLLKKGEEALKDPYPVLDLSPEGRGGEGGAGAEERETLSFTCEEAGDPIEQSCHHTLHIEIEITPGWVEEHWKCKGYEVPNYRESHNSGGGPSSILWYSTYFHDPDSQECRRGCYYTRPGECMKDYQRIEHPDVITITKEEWVEDCSRLERLTEEGICQYESKVCTEGPSVKMIQDRPVSKDCWQYRQTYHCQYPSQNSCSPLRAKGCLQKASRCKERRGGKCVLWEQTYECPSSKRSLRKRKAGPGSPFCITGKCADSSYQTNGEILEVMAKLSVFREMQKDIQKGSFELFKGTDKRCSRNCVDFKDCCQKGKGWGTSLHLASCSEEEKLLAELKSKNLCHQVGTYCSKKVLGVCVSKKTSYCCFGNKLLRILQEQGRAQLGIGWGEAENPCCRGLRPEELARVDFSRLDLGEVFEEIRNSIKQPDSASLQARTAETLKENLRHIQSGTRQPHRHTGEAGEHGNGL